MSCSTSIAKLILFVFNFCFFLFGAASIGVGIWVAVARNEIFKFVNLIDSKVAEGSSKEQIDAVANQSGLIVIAAYVLIVIGVITFIVGFCGCCGAMKESASLLNIYAVLIGIVLAIEILAAVLAAVFRSKIQTRAESAMLRLQEKFFVSLPEYVDKPNSGNAAVTYFINFMQISFKCCGAKSVNDIKNSSSWLNSTRTWHGKTLVNPATCCKLKDVESVKASLKPNFQWNNFTDYLEDENCPFTQNSNSIHQTTCYSGVMEFVSTYSTTIMIICIAIAAFELLGIIFACCLVNALRNN